MKYAELQALMPAWQEKASKQIWHHDRTDGQHPSFNTCKESNKIPLDSLYQDHCEDPELIFGNVFCDNPRLLSLDNGHLWVRVPVEDRPDEIFVDLTSPQTGHELPWVCHTKAELATLGLHYAVGHTVPYFY